VIKRQNSFENLETNSHLSSLGTWVWLKICLYILTEPLWEYPLTIQHVINLKTTCSYLNTVLSNESVLKHLKLDLKIEAKNSPRVVLNEIFLCYCVNRLSKKEHDYHRHVEMLTNHHIEHPSLCHQSTQYYSFEDEYFKLHLCSEKQRGVVLNDFYFDENGISEASAKVVLGSVNTAQKTIHLLLYTYDGDDIPNFGTRHLVVETFHDCQHELILSKYPFWIRYDYGEYKFHFMASFTKGCDKWEDILGRVTSRYRFECWKTYKDIVILPL
jgi:hypothetical protein